MYFILGFVLTMGVFAFYRTAAAGWSLKELPLSYRWDLVGWAWLELQLTLSVCFLLIIGRSDIALPALLLVIPAHFLLPSKRRSVILEGAAVAAAKTKPEDGAA